jgi:glycosyltransferase involved in cell wall biosynthesis
MREKTEREVVFTICARNYLAQATVLARSLSEHAPGRELVVFLLDADTESTASEFLQIVAAPSVVSGQEWQHRTCYYDLLELATSIKPNCFSYLFKLGYEIAIYFDPDILILKPIEAVLSAIATADVVLTPHILVPFPADGRIPNDLTILRCGLYNLGFVAFRNTVTSQKILDWWNQHLHTMCLADVNEGVFTDQKWVDLIPLLSGKAHILRHPGYNIAYWNLHERTVRKVDGAWRLSLIDGSEADAVFFHFSGYSPGSRAISKHENRYRTRPPGDLAHLFACYGNALVAAGYDRHRIHPAPVAHFKNGARWDLICRALYRQVVRTHADLGCPIEDPEFLKWVSEKPDGDHLSRYLRMLMKLRPDLALAFRDGRNIVGLATWLREAGIKELDVDPRLLQELGILPHATAIGVNYVGYLNSHLGIAEAARNAISALHAVEVDVNALDISPLTAGVTGEYGSRTTSVRSGSPYSVTILGVNADNIPSVISDLPTNIGSTFRIGFWAWETTEFPEEWCAHFDFVDEVWVATQFIADAIRAKATVPVVVIPYMVDPPRVEADRPWLKAVLPEVDEGEFLFLFQFDVSSIPFRKNPEATINAFKLAFDPDQPVRLIVKVMNGKSDPDLLSRLQENSIGHKITVWDHALGNLDRFRLMATIDCFVSLHRSEGFGLSIAEAMAYGKPVIATNWSGNTDFATSENAALVCFDLIVADRQHGPYKAGTVWAEPSLESAVAQMRRVFTDAEWRDSIGTSAAKRIVSGFSPQVVGSVMRRRLERLHRSDRLARRRGADILDADPQRIGQNDTRPIKVVSLIRITLVDFVRFPDYYVTRITLLPTWLKWFGVIGTLRRLATIASSSEEVKRKRLRRHSLLRTMLRFIRRRLRF